MINSNDLSQPDSAGSLVVTKQLAQRFLGNFCHLVQGGSRGADSMPKTLSATPTRAPRQHSRPPHHQSREERATPANYNRLTTSEAAARLRQSEVTLRRRFARNARATADGIVARVDGLVARKSGSRWLIWLGSAWNIDPSPLACAPPAADYALPPAESA